MTVLNNDLLSVSRNLQGIRDSIRELCLECGRNPDEIMLEAVTKTVAPEIINYAIENGVSVIGENKVQELNEKLDRLSLEHCKVHLIGHLQTNKVKDIIGKASMIESVDSLHLAKEIDKQAEKADLHQNILLQVNIGKDPNKFGFGGEELEQAVRDIAVFPNLFIRGLMTILPFSDNREEKMQLFGDMYHLFIDIKAKNIDNVSMDYLSMGMSHDYKEAILCGANIIRVGTALFGARNYNGGN